MLRRRFLSLVAQVTMWLLWAASDLAASRASSGSGTGSSASGMPSAVFAMTRASRSSVLASPANSLAAWCAASPGRYATPSPASLAREIASKPMLRHWSTTTIVSHATWENRTSRSPSELRTRLLSATSPSRVTSHAQCDDLPTSMPKTALGGDIADGMVVSFQSSVDRNAASRDTHITWPWLILAEGPAVSYQSSETAAPASATPPGPSWGRGGRPSAGARSAVPRDLRQS